MNSEQAEVMDEIKADPDRGFLCLDWDDEDPLMIFGRTSNYSNN